MVVKGKKILPVPEGSKAKPITDQKRPFNAVVSEKQKGFSELVEDSFVDILGYGRGEDTDFNKMANKLITNINASLISLSVPAFVKQYISVFTISIKNGLNPIDIIRENANFNNLELSKWLMENSGTFYQRAKIGGNIALADTVLAEQALGLTKYQEKLKDILGAPTAFADAHVLVSAFAVKLKQVKKENPNLSEQEARVKALEFLEKEVMLYAVASVDTAFRSKFSTSRNPVQRIASRFMGENIMQISGILSNYNMWKNGVTTAQPVRAIGSLFTSSILAALISTAFRRLRGDLEDEEVVEEFFFNELLLNNLIGAIPYINLISQNFNFTPSSGVSTFKPTTPVIGEISSVFESVFKIYDKLSKGEDATREILRLVENGGMIFGIPAKNITRLGQYALRFASIFGDDTYADFEEFYYSRTATQQLNDAIKSGNKEKADMYVERTVNNAAVKNEIVRVFMETGSKISLYQADTFSAKNPVDGKMVKYNIPSRTREKYNILTQRALLNLVRSSSYKRLTDEEKTKAIQRVINYYYNFMKNEILVQQYRNLDRKTKEKIGYDNMRSKKLLELSEVIKNATKKED